MKKSIFLIIFSNLLLFLIPILNIDLNKFDFNFNKNNNITNTTTYNTKINIDKGQYLDLAYKNGKFYSWNQEETSQEHIIGIFSSEEKSYLVNNNGKFFNLDFEITNFQRINNKFGVATIEYLTSNDEIFLKKNFFIELEDNKINIDNTSPLKTNNPYFSGLNEKYFLAYGASLEKIDFEKKEVTSIIDAYNRGNALTSFYCIDDNSGIFIDDDKNYYLLTDITTDNLKITNIKHKSSNKNNNVVVINKNNLIIRDEKNQLWFVNINDESVSTTNLNFSSYANKIGFKLDKETFILNVSFKNSSANYGEPYLGKINQLDKITKIPNISTINDLIFFDEKSGILIDKNLISSTFNYQEQDNTFILKEYGTLNNVKFINKNLFFGNIEDKNLLLQKENNPKWASITNIQFLSNNKINFLNTSLIENNKEINNENYYFSNGPVTLNITDEKLDKIEINAENSKTKILHPDKKNNITTFLSEFTNYKITFTFKDFQLSYKLKINQFSNKDEYIDISGSNLMSYVGYSLNNFKAKLYDIKTIDEETYKIKEFNYDLVQYIKLYTFYDTKDMVVKNIQNLKSNSTIKSDEDFFFFGLKIINLLNETSWIFLGFSLDGVLPMINFWNTNFGKNLMQNAIKRRYSEEELKKMNSEQILKLIELSQKWKTVATRGKIALLVISINFILAFIGCVVTLIINIIWNKKIKIEILNQQNQPIAT